MITYEGKWDCAQCLEKGIRGTLRDCPVCGDSRNPFLDPEERPYLPENPTVTTDDKDLVPDWNCGECGEANSGANSVCANCKAPKGADDAVAGTYVYVDGVEARGDESRTDEIINDDHVDAVLQSADKLQALADGPVTMPTRTMHRDALRHRRLLQEDAREQREKAHEAARAFLARIDGPWYKRPLVIGTSVLVLGIISVFLYVNFIATHPVDLTVTSVKWERQIEVEEFRTLTLEDWDVPSDGRIISSRREIRSYRQVLDHYETRTRRVPEQRQTGTRTEQYACGSRTIDYGNGRFGQQTTYCTRTVPVYETVYRTETYQEPVYRNEPVYDTKYTYQVDRWVTDHFDTASGTTNPYWPETTAKGDKQRVGDERREAYLVTLRDPEGRSFDRKTDETTWSKVRVGMTLRGEQTRAGELREVHWQ